ncbi:hypothetical protein D3C72_1419600 [compost metagenome]
MFLDEKLEQRADHAASQQIDQQDGARRFHCRKAEQVSQVVAAPAGEHVDQDEQRHHHQILEHQNGKARLAGRRLQGTLVGQQLHHDGRRRQRQHQAQHDGRFQRQAKVVGHAADQASADGHLPHARAEYPAPQRPQPFRRQFQADHEHQEHHAQLGQAAHLLGPHEREIRQPRKIAGPQAEAERAEQGAHCQEAQHLVDLQALQ